MLRNFNMVCILSDVNKIDPNLTFRSSRTPSVCQYKHQSLVHSIFGLYIWLIFRQASEKLFKDSLNCSPARKSLVKGEDLFVLQ